MQYYTDRTVPESEYEKNVKSAANFLIEIEKIASKVTKSDIENIRRMLEKIIEKPEK
jgi:hypothetical protein